MKEFENISLLPYTTFGVDAKAAKLIEYDTLEELLQLLPTLATCPWLHIGAGSNLLFLRDYPGVILHSGLKGITVQEQDTEVLLKAASGEVWDDVVAYAVNRGWSGMENLSAIPGEVGASAVQNIGAYGVEAQDLIVEMEAVEVATGQVVTIQRDQCAYGYRQSIFKNQWKGKYIIISVTYRLQKTFTPKLNYGNIRQELERVLGADYEQQVTLAQLRQTIIEIRNSKLPDPKVLGNAGSFFMNPVIGRDLYMLIEKTNIQMPFYDVDKEHVKIPAGWLIDQCGWKGKRVGNVGVYEKQALILVNYGGGTGQEIAQLSAQICADVKEKFGLTIHSEVNFIEV